jgi:hypothetical protein
VQIHERVPDLAEPIEAGSVAVSVLATLPEKKQGRTPIVGVARAQ